MAMPPIPPPEMAAAMGGGGAPMPTGGGDPMSAMQGPGSPAAEQMGSMKSPEPKPGSNSRYEEDPDVSPKDWGKMTIELTSSLSSPKDLAEQLGNAATAPVRASLDLASETIKTVSQGVTDGLKDNLGPVGQIAAVPIDIASKVVTGALDKMSDTMKFGDGKNDSVSMILKATGPGKRSSKEDLEDSFEKDDRGSLPKKQKLDESPKPASQTPTDMPTPAPTDVASAAPSAMSAAPGMAMGGM